MAQRVVSVASQAPLSENESTERRARSGEVPMNERGAVELPTAVAAKGPGVVVAPTIRSSQPVRSDEPGAARSISSMSVKCDRVGLGWPRACTMASLLVSHSGLRGARAGCSAKREVMAMPRDWGTAMFGRAAMYAGSATGATADRPSKPPRKDSTTRVSPV